ncbi:hypothetical protein [Schinkia azotoformans]|uniref:hypothetical protein n=1 Tax=Schinkia azotoformans TaxID=1454 RepID=UPI002DBFC55A|nr:hypothetical protein [Schinkia azotoformans]MEC1759887.1 hypothetical protein [Schinkia azotoformans]
MNTQYYPNRIEHSNFQNFELLYEGIKRKGIYLLEYHDIYLKDAFVTQLAEQFIRNGSEVLFMQEEQAQYSLRDIFLSRTLFKQNPHQFPFVSQITPESVAFLNPPFIKQFNDLKQRTSIILIKSKHPVDYYDSLFEAVNENSRISMVIVDSQKDYFLKTNIYPQLSWMSFNKNVTILFTSKVIEKHPTYKFTDLSTFVENTLYLHSKHPDLYSLADSKNVAYEFELDSRTPSNKGLKSYFTVRPASAYCQVG